MKLALFVFAFFALCSISLSALSRYGPPPAGKPGYCWTDVTGPMEKGEEKQLKNKCEWASCNGDKTVTLASCGVARINGVRITKVDLSKPYPRCCPGNY